MGKELNYPILFQTVACTRLFGADLASNARGGCVLRVRPPFALPDHLGRLIEDSRRHRDAEGLSRLQVDDQVELVGPLNGEVTRLRTP